MEEPWRGPVWLSPGPDPGGEGAHPLLGQPTVSSLPPRMVSAAQGFLDAEQAPTGLGGGTPERGRAHTKTRRCPRAWPVGAGLGGGLSCVPEQCVAHGRCCFFERVKIGEPGEGG